MQSMDCINNCSLHSAKLLGVSVSGRTGRHNVGKKGFKSGGGISVRALGFTSDLGAGAHDRALVSI